MCVLYYRSLMEYKLLIKIYNVRKSHSEFLTEIHFTVNHIFKFHVSQLCFCYYLNYNYYLIVKF